MEPILRLDAVVVDCLDAKPMVAFYEAAWGPPAIRNTTTASRVGPVVVCFREVPDYRPPTWPSAEVPMQVHFDFSVRDMAEAERLLCELGATVPEFQPHPELLRALLDPAGHPFCIGLPV